MNASGKLLLWMGFAAMAVFAFYLWAMREDPALAARMAEAPAVVREMAGVPAGEGQAAVPAEQPPAEAPLALPDPTLPALDNSDPAVSAALRALLGEQAFRAWFDPQGLVRRVVVTVDMLTLPRLPMRHRVVRAVPGVFKVTEGAGELRISAENAGRYEALLNALLSIDATHWVKIYRAWYPLLQQAYAEIADRRHLFNDRVLAVLDHLIAVEIPTTSPALVHPGVLYQYADPALEARSSGTRILLRLGPGQATRVQARLSEIRRLLVTAPPA